MPFFSLVLAEEGHNPVAIRGRLVLKVLEVMELHGCFSADGCQALSVS